MHHGAYVGKSATKETRILILGESHHNKNNEGQGEPALYKTSSVVESYLTEEITSKTHRFFHKIAQSFGIDTNKADEKKEFWDKIYFGNYIDVVCGVKDGVAKEILKQNREKYNKELFQFINKNKIDIICCFSRLVCDQLPKRVSFNDESTIKVSKPSERSDYIKKLIYKPGVLANSDIVLNKKLIVYGFRHPSSGWGFYPEHYKEYLQKEIHL